MRQTYRRSDETFKVLADHLGEFAAESDKDVSYFNKLKNDNEPDPFARFLALFRIGCRTTAPVNIWLNRLNAEYVRSRRLHVAPGELSTAILQKVESDSATLRELFSSIQDGKLDKAECQAILAQIEKNTQIAGQIEHAVLARLGELENRDERGLRIA
jgi:hypothetical protein